MSGKLTHQPNPHKWLRHLSTADRGYATIFAPISGGRERLIEIEELKYRRSTGNLIVYNANLLLRNEVLRNFMRNIGIEINKSIKSTKKKKKH